MLVRKTWQANGTHSGHFSASGVHRKPDGSIERNLKQKNRKFFSKYTEGEKKKVEEKCGGKLFSGDRSEVRVMDTCTVNAEITRQRRSYLKH